MNNEFEIAIELYDKYKNSYQSLSNQAKQRKDKKVAWSNTYLDLYPYQHILDFNQRSKPKIYSSKPKSIEGIIESWMQDGEVFFAFNAENIEWGASFIINDNDRKILLKFIQDWDDDIVLHQIFCIMYNGESIEQILFYLKDVNEDEDDDEGEENFIVHKYSYIDGKVDLITKDGFYYERSNHLPASTFRFEYSNGQVFIYANDLKASGRYEEKLVYNGKEEIP